jgi:hypothetical protein
LSSARSSNCRRSAEKVQLLNSGQLDLLQMAPNNRDVLLTDSVVYTAMPMRAVDELALSSYISLRQPTDRLCCKRKRTDLVDTVTKNRPALFRGRHFEEVLIMLCVRWYLRYSLSYRDLEEMMAERGLSVDHVTIWRWVQRYAPILNQRLRSVVYAAMPKRLWMNWRCPTTSLFGNHRICPFRIRCIAS